MTTPEDPLHQAGAAQRAQDEQELRARVNRFVNNLPIDYGTPQRVAAAAQEAAQHYGYTGALLRRFVELAAARYQARLCPGEARRLAARGVQALGEEDATLQAGETSQPGEALGWRRAKQRLCRRAPGSRRSGGSYRLCPARAGWHSPSPARSDTNARLPLAHRQRGAGDPAGALAHLTKLHCSAPRKVFGGSSHLPIAVIGVWAGGLAAEQTRPGWLWREGPSTTARPACVGAQASGGCSAGGACKR